MAFLDEIGKTIAGRGKEAAQKAKDAAGVLQLKAQISSEKGKIKELYAAIGALYFKKHRGEEADEYRMFFPEIEKGLALVAQLEEKVMKLEGGRACGRCGAMIRRGDAFCGKCGAPAEPEREEPAALEAAAPEEAEAVFEEEKTEL